MEVDGTMTIARFDYRVALHPLGFTMDFPNIFFAEEFSKQPPSSWGVMNWEVVAVTIIQGGAPVRER